MIAPTSTMERPEDEPTGLTGPIGPTAPRIATASSGASSATPSTRPRSSARAPAIRATRARRRREGGAGRAPRARGRADQRALSATRARARATPEPSVRRPRPISSSRGRRAATACTPPRETRPHRGRGSRSPVPSTASPGSARRRSPATLAAARTSIPPERHARPSPPQAQRAADVAAFVSLYLRLVHAYRENGIGVLGDATRRAILSDWHAGRARWESSPPNCR